MRWYSIISLLLEVGDLQSIHRSCFIVYSSVDLGVGSLPDVVVLENRNLRKHNVLLFFSLSFKLLLVVHVQIINIRYIFHLNIH